MKILPILLLFVTSALGANDYLITDFGARGDGKSDNTRAVQDAIDKCSVTGGRVIFPQGEYLTGSVQIKSNVEIHLESTAVWSAIPDTSKYIELSFNSRRAFIYADHASYISITGKGTINGNGDHHEAFIPAPGGKHIGVRPYGILLWQCKHITVSDVRLLNSPFWMFRIDQCEDIQLTRLHINNHSNYNNDGLDITDSERITISDCILDCEDDALCFKSESGNGVRDVVVTNCILSSHASAIKWGTGSSAAFERVAISNCVIRPSLVRHSLHPAQQLNGLAGIDISNTDGGTVANVSFNNIIIDGVQTAIFVRLGNRNRVYHSGDSNRGRDSTRTGAVRGLSFSNIKAVNIGEISSSITAFPGQYIEDIHLLNIDISYRAGGTAEDTSEIVPEYSSRYPVNNMFRMNLPSYGFYLRHVKNITIDGLTLRPVISEPRYAIVLDDVHDAVITRLEVKKKDRESAIIREKDVSKIRVETL